MLRTTHFAQHPREQKYKGLRIFLRKMEEIWTAFPNGQTVIPDAHFT